MGGKFSLAEKLYANRRKRAKPRTPGHKSPYEFTCMHTAWLEINYRDKMA
jgi:hypothetical protein